MSDKAANDNGSPVVFRFSNIGPVKDAKLQLGRLTVIAGRNNTGKTYVAYSLYGFLKMWRHLPAIGHFGIVPGKEIHDAAEMLQSSERAVVPLPSSFVGMRKLLMRKLGTAYASELSAVFSSRKDAFPESIFAAELDASVENRPPSALDAAVSGTGISITHDGTDLTVAVDTPATRERAQPMIRRVVQAYYRFLLHDLFPDPFILSAERFGISLFYRELDFTKNQLVDLLQKLADEGPRRSISPYLIIDRTTSRYALPIKDNIDFTRSIPDLPKGASALADHKLFDDVKNLIGGYYGNATEDIRFISKARGKGRSFNIPLHLASSSARGLSDLYFYLRHTAAHDQLLIIDEPESHLDTRNQVLFARMLARFVTAGLRVLVSTHSDYLVKEFNNLIMLSRDFPEREAVARKLGYEPGEGLDPRSVRAYVAEAGGLTECEIGPFGIGMPVFDETIDQINDAAIELSSRAGEGS